VIKNWSVLIRNGAKFSWPKEIERVNYRSVFVLLSICSFLLSTASKGQGVIDTPITRFGPLGSVVDVDLSPDQNYLAISTKKNLVHLYDAKTLR